MTNLVKHKITAAEVKAGDILEKRTVANVDIGKLGSAYITFKDGYGGWSLMADTALTVERKEETKE